jgi:hypothetical protein
MRNFLAFVLLGTSLVACVRRGDDTESAESALDSADSVDTEGNLMMATMDGADMAATGLTADDVATRIAANVANRWQPTGCATVDQQGSSITITYNDCTGPRGLIHVSGQLVLTVQVKLDGTISVHGTSGDLTANDAHLVVDVDATYASTGTGHTLTVSTSGSATGPRGFELEHTGDYTITWDTTSQCRSLAGSWATELTRTDGTTAQRSTQANMMRCAGGCPVGTVSRTFATGTMLTVTFDGTSTAQWQTSTGRSGSITLQCP